MCTSKKGTRNESLANQGPPNAASVDPRELVGLKGKVQRPQARKALRTGPFEVPTESVGRFFSFFAFQVSSFGESLITKA